MADMKIKVDVNKLIERIETKRDEAEKAFGKKASEFEAEQLEWRKQIIDGLGSEIKRVRDAEWEKLTTARRYGGARAYYFEATLPEPPTQLTFDASEYDKDISILQMSCDTTIFVQADDRFGRYL